MEEVENIIAIFHTENLVYGLSSSARRVFIASIMHRKQEILAVQTLRNWVMTASALCSTSIIVIFGLVAFVSAIGNVRATSSENIMLFQGTWFLTKIIILVVLFMASFFFFSQAMRFFNHVAMLVNINITEDELRALDPHAEIAYKTLSPDFVANLLNRGAFFNSAGMRMYFISFPVVSWLGGPYYMIAATCVLLLVLRSIDFNLRMDKKSSADDEIVCIELPERRS